MNRLLNTHALLQGGAQRLQNLLSLELMGRQGHPCSASAAPGGLSAFGGRGIPPPAPPPLQRGKTVKRINGKSAPGADRRYCYGTPAGC